MSEVSEFLEIKRILQKTNETAVRNQAQMIVDVAEKRDLKSVHLRLDKIEAELRELKNSIQSRDPEKLNSIQEVVSQVFFRCLLSS